jgi:outer membrane protein OmpA-like peptidoglycan-associated protein
MTPINPTTTLLFARVPQWVLSRGLLCALLCLTSGCLHSSQLAKLQNEKSQLTAIIAQEKELNAKLESQLVAVNQRAADAERELAILHDGPQASGTSSLASYGKAGRLASLEPWARSHAELKYDAARRVARLPVEITFTSDDRLQFNARRELDKAADLLLSPEARSLAARVSVSDAEISETRLLTRANAVLDYLKQRGVGHDRLEIANRSGRALVDEEGRRTATGVSRVELEILEMNRTANPPSSTVASEPAKEDGWMPAKDRRR